MNRRQKNVALYVVLSAGAVFGAVAVVRFAGIGSSGLLTVAVLCLVPGRIGAYVLRPLIASRRHFAAERFEAAEAAANLAIAQLREQSWRRSFLFLLFAFYTWDALAMAYNNRGASRMMQGVLDDAEEDLLAATARDDQYAIPHYNLAIIAAVRDDMAGADRLLRMAAELGYTGKSTDKLIARVGEAYARIEPAAR